MTLTHIDFCIAHYGLYSVEKEKGITRFAQCWEKRCDEREKKMAREMDREMCKLRCETCVHCIELHSKCNCLMDEYDVR